MMNEKPIFSAVSTSARQLYLLLRCISFAPRAHIEITATGIRFSVDESRVVQGLAFIEKGLFSSYSIETSDQESSIPPFTISLTALLETLQIFGISDSSSSYRNPAGGFTSSYASAFNAPAVALGGTCRITYSQVGSPLSITIQEGSVTTTCDMNTYDIYSNQDIDEGIPLDRNALCLKIIMRSEWLNDAIAELSNTNPTDMTVIACDRSSPYFALEGHGGPFGDSTVDFMPASKADQLSSGSKSKSQPLATETFVVAAPPGSHGRLKQRYKFDLIKKAGRAMALASKVSIRQDSQGVLSLQFMIEVNEGGAGPSNNPGNLDQGLSVVGNGGRVSFIDFRFVPLVYDDESEEEEDR